MRFKYAMMVLLLVVSGCASPNPWAKAKAPAILEGRSSEAIGTPSAGCLLGGMKVPSEGRGYRLVRQKRWRQFGHPSMLAYLEKLGTEADGRGLSLLVADLAQPRGGPVPGDHGSHQMGLDMDVWLWQPGIERVKALTDDEREDYEAPSMVAPVASDTHETVNRAYWNDSVLAVLRAAVAHPEVDRIFINPVIKRELCVSGERGEWLHKLRPWWGHDRHFHVRLLCPEGSQKCGPGSAAPIPPGDGCDETLNWWFSEEARALEQDSTESGKIRPLPKLPEECGAVLEAP